MRLTKQMIQTDPVHAAISLAKKVTTATTPEEARAQLAKKRQEILKLESLKGDLLSVENESKGTLTEKIKGLQQDIRALCAQLIPVAATLPVFDLSCLTWRDEQGFPRLVPFAIDNNKVSFGIRVRNSNWRRYQRTSASITPKFGKEIKNQYLDVIQTLRGMRTKNKSIEIATVFSGAIPDHVRDLIQGAKETFEELYIVAEVKGWKITERNVPAVRSVQGDPILIGFDGKDYRLIVAFDTTTVEQIAVDRSKGVKSS